MNNCLAKNLLYNWHPYTQMAALADNPPLLIERAEGIKLYDAGGRWYYDTISSWWCNVHGHGHPRIREAMNRQMRRLDHVLFGAITHPGAIELSERLVGIAPDGLKRVFYSDNGSTAVEVALKMSVQYWCNTGHSEKKSFVCLERGYHGDTAGCMSVSGIDLFRAPFEPLLFDVRRVPAPYCYRCPIGKDRAQCGTECVDALEQTLHEHSGQLAAVIMEPLLMAAGGMIIYPAEYLRRAAMLAQKYNVHLILDEVATGFGRTGTMFACEQADVSPDFMCVSKGITSGTLPFAATLTTGEVYDAFLGTPGGGKTFYHGHTYTANPLGCAAALASMDLFEENNLLEHVVETASELRAAMEKFRDHKHVGDVRCLGMVAALEMVKDKTTKEPQDTAFMEAIYRKGLEQNIILRPLGNVAYLFLPLCTTREELTDIVGRVGSGLEI